MLHETVSTSPDITDVRPGVMVYDVSDNSSQPVVYTAVNPLWLPTALVINFMASLPVFEINGGGVLPEYPFPVCMGVPLSSIPTQA